MQFRSKRGEVSRVRMPQAIACHVFADVSILARRLTRNSVQHKRPAAILDVFNGSLWNIVKMPKLAIAVHSPELRLKGGNRRFFLSKLHMALKRALEGLPVERNLRPGDRMLVEFGEGASAEEAIARIERVFGVAFYAIARVVPRGGENDLVALERAAWAEVRDEKFHSFAVRAKRSDKSFPHRTSEIEVSVGQHLVDQLRAEGR